MRVKKLESEGYIEGYSAQINVARLGQTLTVFTEITLKNHRQTDFARFLATVEKIEQLIECHVVSGGYDYLLKFVTAGISEYQAIMERLVELDVGIDKYFSFVEIAGREGTSATDEHISAVESSSALRPLLRRAALAITNILRHPNLRSAEAGRGVCAQTEDPVVCAIQRR
ncbi:leucine-responsive regulatory protein (plasmid) [Sinorhizobium americanum]|uniref:Leucine-responsive regulatory protein n=1 Tax=Sinorhizobium americanum TaxID=194963 RepID=A0A1L3LVE9_9HYPH|nr:leucine-responsive regulatory protein [Sinorhizobium americanum]